MNRLKSFSVIILWVINFENVIKISTLNFFMLSVSIYGAGVIVRRATLLKFLLQCWIVLNVGTPNGFLPLIWWGVVTIGFSICHFKGLDKALPGI